MSVVPVLEYLAGILVFGLLKLVMNDIVDTGKTVYTQVINGTTIETKISSAGDFMNYIWLAIILVYLIIGGFVLWRKYTEPQLPGYGG